jgi:hypothetical protein
MTEKTTTFPHRFRPKNGSKICDLFVTQKLQFTDNQNESIFCIGQVAKLNN